MPLDGVCEECLCMENETNLFVRSLRQNETTFVYDVYDDDDDIYDDTYNDMSFEYYGEYY